MSRTLRPDLAALHHYVLAARRYIRATNDTMPDEAQGRPNSLLDELRFLRERIKAVEREIADEMRRDVAARN